MTQPEDQLISGAELAAMFEPGPVLVDTIGATCDGPLLNQDALDQLAAQQSDREQRHP